MNRILSICIPTYNRKHELSELIDEILTIKSDEFDIVVTDNQSTDSTKEMLMDKNDSRIFYYRNDNALPAFMNMIHSIFNANGKYALYCNDRDLLIPERIEMLISMLKEADYSFIYSTQYGRKNNYSIQVFNSEYDSLMGHYLIHHPTGLIYNKELIKQYLNENKYGKFLDAISIYDFLMLDLFKYGKSAVYDCGVWRQREPEYLASHKSGGKLYFVPEERKKMFYILMDYILLQNDFSLNEVQRRHVINYIYFRFCGLFSRYKICMDDDNETAHYGIKKEHISTYKMINIYKNIFNESISHLNEMGYSNDLIKYVKKHKYLYYISVIKICFTYDLKKIVHKFI